jgi:hypothetical protein
LPAWTPSQGLLGNASLQPIARDIASLRSGVPLGAAFDLCNARRGDLAMRNDGLFDRCGRLAPDHRDDRNDAPPCHPQPTFGIDADEDTGTGDVGGIVDCRSVSEREQCRLDLAKALIDLVWQLIGVLRSGLKPGMLGVERIDRDLLLARAIGRRPLELPQTIIVAIWKSTATEIHFQPSAAVASASVFSFSVTSRPSGATSCNQPPSSSSNRSRRIRPPACSCSGPDKQRTAIRRADRVLGQHAADLVWLVNDAAQARRTDRGVDHR